MSETVVDLKYPVGKFVLPPTVSDIEIKEHINVIEKFPKQLREETSMLDNIQLDTPYRQDGWTIRQVVHHVADSHINSYCRFKLAMTEDNPTIKTYLEDKWAETADSIDAPIYISLNLIDAIHARWLILLNNMSASDFERTIFHPEHKRNIKLKNMLALYSWHCKHHLAHITELKKRKLW